MCVSIRVAFVVLRMVVVELDSDLSKESSITASAATALCPD